MRIDNTFYSQKNFANVDLRQVYDFMKKSDTFNVEYHIELFAGMYFHPKKERYPTILFFRTGSYTMMGGTEENISAPETASQFSVVRLSTYYHGVRSSMKK